MMRRFLLLTLLLPLFCAGFGVGARAADGCTATATEINFGKNIDILKGVAIPGVGSVTVSCTLADPNNYKVLVCMGARTTLPTPFMTGPKSAKLEYRMFTDDKRDTPLGSASSVSAINALITSKNANLSATRSFYAQISPGQTASPVGAYTGTFSPEIKYLIFKTNVAAQPNCATAAGMTPLPLTPEPQATAGITAQCSISNVQNMIFPPQTIFKGDVTEQTPAQFTVKCTTDAPYAIGLDDGLNARNGRCSSLSQRCMVSRQNPANRIDYDLYHMPQRLSRWGATDPLAVGDGGKPRSGKYDGEPITVYGKINKPTASPAPGDYFDTVTITVNY